MYGPTPEQQEAGQGLSAATPCLGGHNRFKRLVPQTESLEGAMGKDIAKCQQCIAEVRDPDRSQPLVSCKEPHRGEAHLTFIGLDASEYPSAANSRKQGSHSAASWSPTVTTPTRWC